MVCDNADFNIDTLDGKGTFHFIGSIEILTPESGFLPQKPIKRLTIRYSEAEIATIANILLQIFNRGSGEGLTVQINYKIKYSSSNLTHLNLLWILGKYKIFWVDLNFCKL